MYYYCDYFMVHQPICTSFLTLCQRLLYKMSVPPHLKSPFPEKTLKRVFSGACFSLVFNGNKIRRLAMTCCCGAMLAAAGDKTFLSPATAQLQGKAVDISLILLTSVCGLD